MSQSRSDWDIGLAGPEAIEGLTTLATFDVVDLASAPAGLRERALREGVPL